MNKLFHKIIGQLVLFGCLMLYFQPATGLSLKMKPSADTLVIGILVELQEDVAGAKIAANFISEQIQISPNNLIVKFEIKSVEGSWGITSNRTVSLIYDEGAEIIIGALSGRNAHLVEQVAAKWQIPYFETLATDPSLAKAYVPNFIRLNFSDDQISKSLINLFKEDLSISNAILILEDNYDSQKALDAFTKQYAGTFEKDPLIFIMGSNFEENNLALQVELSENKGSIILLQNQHPLSSMNVDLRAIANNGNTIYAWRTMNELALDAKTSINQLKNHEQNNEFDALEAYFHKKLNRNPRPYEVRLVDAINCSMAAFMVPPNQSAQQFAKQIKENTNTNGMSGAIKFDDLGNLIRSPIWE